MMCHSLIAAAVTSIAIVQSVSAQYQHDGLQLESAIHPFDFGINAYSGNDCWGYVSPSGREYALMGLDNAMAVVEVTDPAHPRIIDTVPHYRSTWCDVKVYQHHAYVTNDTGGPIQIVDLTDVDAGIIMHVDDFGGRNHNIAIDEASGFLYTCGYGDIYDLSTPESPLAVGQMPPPFMHDGHAVTYTSGPYAGRQILFGAHASSGIYIWDVTDKSNVIQLSRATYPGRSYTHQLWTSDDRQYLFVDDELTSTPGTRVFDISNLANPKYLTTFSSGLGSTDHNLYYRAGFVYEANYTSGLRIFDVNDPLNAVEKAWFDTYPLSDSPGYNGAWSVYPYFPSGTIIVSDINRGLFVLGPEDVRFAFPQGRPDHIDPSHPTSFTVVVSDGMSSPVPESAVLHVNAGEGWQSFPMESQGNDEYKAAIPPVPCGQTVMYYITAEAVSGRTISVPHPAPRQTYSAVSASNLVTLYREDFETADHWWVRSNRDVINPWELGTPWGSGFSGDPLRDYDGSGQCFATGLGPGRELDLGSTHLISPAFDSLEGVNHLQLTFARWFYDDPSNDRLKVYVSNDGGDQWVLMRTLLHDPHWVVESIDVGSFVPITNNMRFRFSVEDADRNSLAEAAIDDFRLYAIDCPQPTIQLRLTGHCIRHGGAQVQWSGANPHTTLAAFFARSRGGFIIPGGSPCAGSMLGLGDNQIQLAHTFNSRSGSGSLNATLPASACGGYFQLLQLNDCQTSNVAQAPE